MGNNNISLYFPYSISTMRHFKFADEPLDFRRPYPLTALYFFTLAFCLTSAAGLAGPSVNVTTKYYQIHGNTAADLRRQMNLKGPMGQDNRRYDAYTSWYVSWQYRWKRTNNHCAMTTVTTTVDVTFTLPKWVDYNRANKRLRSKWKRYYKALVDHENGHKDIAIEAAEEIEEAILNMGSRRNCNIIERDANDLGHSIIKKYNELEREYDIRTDHGRKYGAVFP